MRFQQLSNGGGEEEVEKEEVEIKGEEEEDFCVLDDSFKTRNKSEINGQKGTT